MKFWEADNVIDDKNIKAAFLDWDAAFLYNAGNFFRDWGLGTSRNQS